MAGQRTRQHSILSRKSGCRSPSGACARVQLKEEEMATIFKVSRARIRQALAALKREGLVDILPNRGAFVCKPTVREARDVFFVRRTVERCVVEHLCRSATRADIKRLQDHVARNAWPIAAISPPTSSDYPAVFICCWQNSHTPISFAHDARPVSRTSLITAVYRNTDQFNCGPDEHAEIVEAIASQQRDKAVHLMSHHLDHVESELDLRDGNDHAHDLSALLA